MWLTVTVGGGITVRVAADPALLDPAEELTELVVFWKVPVCAAVTDTENVHDAPALTEPPLSEIVCVAGVAVITPVEPQVPFSPLGSSTARPAGRVSVKETADSVPLVFGLLMVNDSAVAALSLNPIRFGVNALVMVGGLAASAVGTTPRPIAAVATTVTAMTPVVLRRPRGRTPLALRDSVPLNCIPLLRSVPRVS
jgi:hypothetical protein